MHQCSMPAGLTSPCASLQNVGLVLVDRNTVTIGMADINISFGAHPAEVPAKIRYLHPLHNFAILSYNPQELPEEARSKVQAAELLAEPMLRRGDQVGRGSCAAAVICAGLSQGMLALPVVGFAHVASMLHCRPSAAELGGCNSGTY